MILLQYQTPVPKDIPLALPMAEWLLITLLIVSFLFHILFVNLMVGGSIVTLWAQIRGLKDKEYDIFAHEIAKTITVNKSIAVVLGVAPLLSINALYALYFYSANALTGSIWIMIIPLVTVAFLLTYLHKYTWEYLENNKKLHIGIIGISVGIFLFIPLIFLTNVNLMMFPEKWEGVKGFFSAMTLPNVWPRYFEFLAGCVAITGVFIYGYNRRKAYRVEEIYVGFSRYKLKRLGYTIAASGFAVQIVTGIIVLFTLPSKGVGYGVIAVMGSAGILLVLALWWVTDSLTKGPVGIDLHFGKVVTAVALFLVAYGGSRQMYRHNALDKHQQLVKQHTEEYQKQSLAARTAPKEEPVIDESTGEFAKGEAIFKNNCAACHMKNQALVGPAITEMIDIYKDDPEGMKKWIKAPGKKRADMTQMPGFPGMSDGDLSELAHYILNLQ